jgi:hypothetical protein
VLAAHVPADANLRTLEAFAEGLQKAAERRSTRATAERLQPQATAVRRGPDLARLPTNRALKGSAPALAHARRSVAAGSHAASACWPRVVVQQAPCTRSAVQVRRVLHTSTGHHVMPLVRTWLSQNALGRCGTADVCVTALESKALSAVQMNLAAGKVTEMQRRQAEHVQRYRRAVLSTLPRASEPALASALESSVRTASPSASMGAHATQSEADGTASGLEVAQVRQRLQTARKQVAAALQAALRRDAKTARWPARGEGGSAGAAEAMTLRCAPGILSI